MFAVIVRGLWTPIQRLERKQTFHLLHDPTVHAGQSHTCRSRHAQLRAAQPAGISASANTSNSGELARLPWTHATTIIQARSSTRSRTGRSLKLKPLCGPNRAPVLTHCNCTAAGFTKLSRIKPSAFSFQSPGSRVHTVTQCWDSGEATTHLLLQGRDIGRQR